MDAWRTMESAMTDEAIRDLFGQVPFWADQTIGCYQPVAAYESFVTEAYWSCCASVNAGELRGMAGLPRAMSWREFLGDRKNNRLTAALKLFRENPGYYSGCPAQRDPPLSFVRVNGRLYVGRDGRLRAAIARFYLYSRECPYLHTVTLHEYTVDFEFMRLYDAFVKSCPPYLRATVAHIPDHREDGSGWKRDYYQELSVHITDTRSGRTSVCDRFALAAAVARLERKASGKWRLYDRIFG